MIGVIDYGVGNLQSLINALEYVQAEVEIVDTPAGLASIEKIVLPGVGAFGAAMERLKERQFIEPLRKAVLGDVKPLLGICLGMQLLADVGTEAGEVAGIGLLPGRVERIPVAGTNLRLPHMGWNDLVIEKKCPLLEGVETGADCYFVHSFHFVPEKPEDISATCDYGAAVTGAISSGNIFGMQFHPEKSQMAGIKILRNFSIL